MGRNIFEIVFLSFYEIIGRNDERLVYRRFSTFIETAIVRVAAASESHF